MNSVEWKIGCRYLWAGWRSSIVAFIAMISLAGIALGVATLVTVMAVMNGFESQLQDKILSSLSHITVQSMPEPLTDWPSVGAQIEAVSGVEAWAPYIETEVMVMNDRQATGVQLRAIDPQQEMFVSNVGDYMVEGDLTALQAGEYRILLGRPLAEKLGVGLGDKVSVVTSDLQITAAGTLPRFKRFTVAGVFELGMHIYDNRLIMVQLDDAARLFRMQEKVSGIRVKVAEAELAPKIVPKIIHQLGQGYWGLDWTQRHSNLFGAIELQKRVMFIILMLVVAVAVFNLISTMVMIVKEKGGDIAILRTLGLTSFGIVRIFMILGTLIGAVGIGVGLTIGGALSLSMESLVSLLQRVIGVDLLSQEVYLISTLPGKMNLSDVLMIVILTFILSFTATLYPAWRAAQIPPAEALNREQ